MFRTVGRLAALGPGLLGASLRAPRTVAGTTASTAVHLVRTAVESALAPPAAVLRQATAARDRRPDRRVWTADGRAQVEVRGLDGPDGAPVAAAVEQALTAVPGVQRALVDAVTGRAVVRFDPAQLPIDGLADAVARAEETAGAGHSAGLGPPSFPGDTGPVTAEAWALVADLVGLSAAVTGRLLRWPALPSSLAAVGVLVDTQPRLRRRLEATLGTPAADLVLAVANAVTHGLTQGSAALFVDAGQRTEAVLAARAQRAAFAAREAELWAPGRPARHDALEPDGRPVPLPAGPVERYADRAAKGSLLAAGGLLALTGRPGPAGTAILVGAPKAARAAQEAFADTLVRGLAGRGVLAMDPAALRRLDRVDTVLVDSAVLHGTRPLIVSARALTDGWTAEHVWSAGQRLLRPGNELPVPPPRGRFRHRLAVLEPDPEEARPDGLVRRVLTEDGKPVGELLLGTELDPLADAVLGAAHAAGLRLVLTPDAAAPQLAGRADEVVGGPASLAGRVRGLQRDGRVVVVVASDEDALAAADLGVGIVPPRGRVPWAADVLLGPGLADVPRLLAAAARARSVCSRGVSSAAAATFLGVLLAAVGGPRGASRATLPVTAAAGAALLTGTVSARRVCRQPPPRPVLHTPWHALETDEVLDRLPPPDPEPEAAPARSPLGSLGRFLDPAAALARNVAAELADPLTPVLGTGAAASAVIGSPTDALLVGGVLAANALISGAQRLRADRALNQLLAGQQLPARLVSPEGESRTVAAARLRVGHVVDLQPGDVVPADARLLRTDALEVDEASLTGESVAIDKQTAATPGAELADRTSMVYEGTTVLAGTGRAVVVAVGPATEAGRAVALAGRAGAPAGMQARLEELTRRGLPITLLGGAAVTGLAMLRAQPLRRALASGVSVAVAAVPEGLPLVATVAQQGAARRLSARGVLVRSARTVEALGRVDTVCFDKTGTLTEGRLRLARLAGPAQQEPPDAVEAGRILRAAARSGPLPGDGRPIVHATDQAIIDAAQDALGPGYAEDWEELSELPFQSDRGYSAAIGRTGNQLRLVVKGAPEVLLPRCTHQRDHAGKRLLDRAGRDRALGTVHELAADGLRVLAVARRNLRDVLAETDADQGGPDPEELTEDLTLLGFVALADTPRPQSAATVAAMRDAGLATAMITGDHPVTARAIAAQLGIPAERVVTGPEFAGLDEAAAGALAAGTSVFARVSPEQKLRIIGALQRAGRVVAMVGDGANDAAAIRLADVGIGMAARGSTSARTAADLVLTDPDVGLLLDALVEGRAMWGRVRDAVAVLLGGNAGEVGFTVVGTALAGRAPIGTRQFLLVNMLTDLLPSMAIALAPTPQDPAERRRLLTGGVPSLGAPLLRDIATRGAATGIGALAAWLIGRGTGTRRRAGTMALAALVGTQLGQTLLIGGRDPLVLATALGSIAVLVAIVQIPGVSQFFGCTPLDPLAWLTVAACAAGTTVLAAVAGRLLPATDAGRAAGPVHPQEDR